jgi:hypothetical protein
LPLILKQRTAAIVNVDDDGHGGRTVTQVALTTSEIVSGTAIIPIQWYLGPIATTGSIDTSTLAFNVSASIVGIALGDTIQGNLKDGVTIDFNLFVASGELKYYLKNGNEVWTHVDVKVRFDGSFFGDYKLLTI